jgi:hypothetical protein
MEPWIRVRQYRRNGTDGATRQIDRVQQSVVSDDDRAYVTAPDLVVD